MVEAVQVFAPGERLSYCNSGYVVLGRLVLVEVLRGKSFNRALREQLITHWGWSTSRRASTRAILAQSRSWVRAGAAGRVPGAGEDVVARTCHGSHRRDARDERT
ncbi:serine hydrolase [Saccharothrix sp. ALI-22-I]|uniref:serine hydrolase n=1 Tax=Saccharothrix sp. ALI-22-I TaxID=1933778 RepID=UPI00097C43D4